MENAFFSDEQIHDCAVVGIPYKRLGELVAVVVVLRYEFVGKVTDQFIGDGSTAVSATLGQARAKI